MLVTVPRLGIGRRVRAQVDTAKTWATPREALMDPMSAEPTYAVIYAAARDLGYSELEAMVYATEPDLFVADHPGEVAPRDA